MNGETTNIEHVGVEDVDGAMFVEGRRRRYGGNGCTEGCDTGMCQERDRVVGGLPKDPSEEIEAKTEH